MRPSVLSSTSFSFSSSSHPPLTNYTSNNINYNKPRPWQWKLQLLNAAATFYFLCLSLGSLIIGTLVTLPDIYRDDESILHARRMAAYIICGLNMLNYICLRYYGRKSRVDSYTGSSRGCLPTTTTTATTLRWGEEGGDCTGGGGGGDCYGGGGGVLRACGTCEVMVPLRAKHCPVCQACVLKRDHHCFFSGSCVGFHNQRYFVAFTFTGTLGALYSSYVTYTYLGAHYAPILSTQCYAYLLPWLLWNWAAGDATVDIVALVLFSYFCVFTIMACAGFFFSQCFLVLRGQTSYEYRKGIGRYRYSIMENVRSVFGPLWFVSFFLPLPFMRCREHNGVDWKVVHDDFKQN